MNFYSGVQHGHRVEITPLPKAQKNWPISHIIHEQKSPRKEEMATDWPEANDLLLKEVQSGKRIIVSDELKSLPANNEAAAASKKSHISDEKLFEAVRNHPLRIWVSRQQYARGLRIMNALHKALEERGFKVFKKARRNPSAVEIIGEKVQFALYEKHRKVEKELNDFDKQRLRQGFSVYRYDYLPSGKPLGIPDDSQGMSDYLSILDCERKDLGKILHFCEEFAKYVENPVVKQEEEVEDDF